MRRYAVLIFVLLATSVARADRIHLRSCGRVVEGHIIKETEEKVLVQTRYGAIWFEREEILRIEEAPTLRERYRARKKALEPDDVQGRMDLLSWCREEGVREGLREQAVQIVALDPDHAEAREALGHRRFEGTWRTKGEIRRIKYERRVESMRAVLRDRRLTLSMTRNRFDILLTALRGLTGRRMELHPDAEKHLKATRFRMTYACERRPVRLVLRDIERTTDLSVVLLPDRVWFGLPDEARKLRKRENVPPPRRTGSKRLSHLRISLDWAHVALGEALENLRTEFGIALHVDDRIPASRLTEEVELHGHEEPVQALLQKVLNPRGLDIVRVGDVLFVTTTDQAGAMRGSR